MPTKKAVKSIKTKSSSAKPRVKRAVPKTKARQAAAKAAPASVTPVVVVPAAPAVSIPAPVSVSPAAAAKAVTPVAQPTAPAVKQTITPEQRFEMIQREAYLIAEKNGFRGDQHGYWLAAEKHITELLAG